MFLDIIIIKKDNIIVDIMIFKKITYLYSVNATKIKKDNILVTIILLVSYDYQASSSSTPLPSSSNTSKAHSRYQHTEICIFHDGDSVVTSQL